MKKCENAACYNPRVPRYINKHVVIHLCLARRPAACLLAGVIHTRAKAHNVSCGLRPVTLCLATCDATTGAVGMAHAPLAHTLHGTSYPCRCWPTTALLAPIYVTKHGTSTR
jgi:hypothetical protein